MKSRKRPGSLPPVPAPETPAAVPPGAADNTQLRGAPTGAPAAAGAGEAVPGDAVGGATDEAAGEPSELVCSRGAESEERLPSLPFLTVGIGVPVGADKSLLAL
jgi:hypothetical protein